MSPNADNHVKVLPSIIVSRYCPVEDENTLCLPTYILMRGCLLTGLM